MEGLSERTGDQVDGATFPLHIPFTIILAIFPFPQSAHIHGIATPAVADISGTIYLSPSVRKTRMSIRDRNE
jgi:hypothetical protein